MVQKTLNDIMELSVVIMVYNEGCLKPQAESVMPTLVATHYVQAARELVMLSLLQRIVFTEDKSMLEVCMMHVISLVLLVEVILCACLGNASTIIPVHHVA